MSKNIRALAARCLYAVVDQGRSLNDELPKQQLLVDSPKDKGLLQELCYGVLRYLPELELQVRRFVNKPLTGKQRVFHFLMIVGIYQIKYTRIPDHAAVAETVAATAILKNKHLKGLVNAVLRSYQREPELDETLPDAVKYNHPGWFIKKIQAGYPDSWQQILEQNQQRPPMWLRVNQSKKSVTDYLTLLSEQEIEVVQVAPLSQAILLASPVDVQKLPGFSDGWVSVQDGAAQMAAPLLQAQANDNVLDCCAAPGGKTCHILELTPNLGSMTAIDIEAQRLVRVEENLARLGLQANVIAADAVNTEQWFNGQHFDRILLDAPCSGTGVIRKNPDIKWLRRASDIDSLVVLQQQILKSIWALLKPGGTMIYATCSILPEENTEQVKRFVENNADAHLEDLAIVDNCKDWQILPGENSMDGFYYAKLTKKAVH
ncbi:16S rRNA (cytosine(967)-C(5))-methyltransferase RsmB [Thalassomonas sp. M1454]|uniref:16S rRNA (cytosine(967)-C(5))-methyltransferase RsmB n=1 Tax=Thalassomonas sp. M1454 TaxID=2594477 RepID=UPI00117FC42F|nr:16S rRNA (cytosine(967)-C(5))-methyltransferase RsmB [Thalassomonas sp. M1454]TRX58149.1 16S rRNA (cytosine(967)-C(5))-methyltransferase RsmB [Thalassomonas sp. M1454]